MNRIRTTSPALSSQAEVNLRSRPAGPRQKPTQRQKQAVYRAKSMSVDIKRAPHDPNWNPNANDKPHRLLHYHEIPPWQQENEYLLSGYRPTSSSTGECVWSCFARHNETVNILSHVIGCVVFGAFLPWHFQHFVYEETQGVQAIDALLFRTYFFGVAVCFLCSATCHVVWNHSPAVAVWGNSMDYLGIVLLMWGASLPSIYYGFICDASLRNVHWGVTSAIAAGCIITALQRRFRRPGFRTYRAVMYTALGCSSIVFVAHGILVHGWTLQERRMALRYMLLMAAFNLVGAVAYTARIPERLFPYTFDIVGASHQIFHVMVIFAGLVHYVGLVQALKEVRQISPGCVSDGVVQA